MANINKTIIKGNLTRDPELKSTNTGTYLCTFSVAVNSYQGKDKEDYVSFFDCTAWGKRAEVMSKYLAKGKPVIIEGNLRQQRWEDADGKSRSKVVIYVDNFEFAGGKPDDNNASTGNAVQDDFHGEPATGEFPEPFNDDIPF